MPGMNKMPWYHSGLRFQCTRCGNCCTGAPGYVWVNKDEIESLARAVGEADVETFEDKYVRRIGIRKSLREYPGGDCVFFDTQTQRCAVYEARPRQCRSWPFWDSNLRTPAKWEETCRVCPGCGVGRVFELEQIEACRRLLRV